jgi:ankyrin repeat protein
MLGEFDTWPLVLVVGTVSVFLLWHGLGALLAERVSNGPCHWFHGVFQSYTDGVRTAVLRVRRVCCGTNPMRFLYRNGTLSRLPSCFIPCAGANDDEALRSASITGNAEAISRLLSLGADVNTMDPPSGRTPLMNAATFSFTRIASLLVEAGADVNAVDQRGRSALKWTLMTPANDVAAPNQVCRGPGSDIAEMLLDAGANIDDALLDEAQEHEYIPVFIQAGLKEGALPSVSRSLLAWAVQRGGRHVVRQLIDGGVDVNTLEERTGKPFLSLAARAGHREALKELIDAGADVNLISRDGKTALIATVEAGKDGIIDQLIRAGADINVVGNDGDSPLWKAVRTSHEDMLRELIRAGANTEAQDAEGVSPLEFSERNNKNPAIRSILLAARTIINDNTQSGLTHLERAALYGRTKQAADLIQAGAHVSVRLSDALALAAENGHVDIMQLLLDAGAVLRDLPATMNPVKILSGAAGSISVGSADLVRKLIACKINSRAFPEALVCASRAGNMDTVRVLLDAGADVNAGTRYNVIASDVRDVSDGKYVYTTHITTLMDETALRIAARLGNVALVRLLLRVGADVHAADHDGTTARTMAYGAGHTDVVAILDDAIAASLARLAYSPLTLAVVTGEEQRVDALIHEGVDVNAKEGNGETPLWRAVKSCRLNCVLSLIRAGADVDVCVSQHTSMLEWAAAINHPIMSFILSHAQDILTMDAAITARRLQSAAAACTPPPMPPDSPKSIHGTPPPSIASSSSNVGVGSEVRQRRVKLPVLDTSKLCEDEPSALSSPLSSPLITARPPLTYRTLASAEGMASVVRLLIAAGVNDYTEAYSEALVWAARAGNNEIVTQLIESAALVHPGTRFHVEAYDEDFDYAGSPVYSTSMNETAFKSNAPDAKMKLKRARSMTQMMGHLKIGERMMVRGRKNTSREPHSPSNNT